MSSLPNRFTRAPPSDSILPLHHPTGAGEDGAGPSSSRPRARSQPGGLWIPSLLSSSPSSAGPGSAPPPLASPSTPLSPGTPGGSGTAGRRRAHTVSVSFGRPREGSLDARSPVVGPGRGLPTHAEGAESPQRTRRGSSQDRRRESIMDRIRDSIDERERRDSLSNNPVGFEVQRNDGSGRDDELHDEVVGMLDVVDTQVSTVNHLQNMTNGIFIPHLPALWSRRPEIVLRSSDEEVPASKTPTGTEAPRTARGRRAGSTSRPRSSTVAALFPPSAPSVASATSPASPQTAHPLATIPSIPLPTPPATAAVASGGTAAGAAAGKSSHSPSSSTDGLTPMEESDLDLHVRRQLKKSKREKAKELLKGTWVFLKTPIGIFVGIYGILVVFWGAALVLILINAIKVGDQAEKNYWVEICSQILTALFTITGVGLIPWRVQDTYRMAIITMYKRRTKVKRRKLGLPPIEDENDLPDPKDQADYIAVLTEKEQAALVYQQEKFAKSQTWYKPHATATHKAFPITWALWNTVLMDGNSIFQCFLCGVMWGINYHVRPAWTTGSLIPLSFLCGIGAAVLIWQGGVRTKKVASVEDKLRQALGVPLAIAIPTTKDGTIIAGANKNPIGLPTSFATSKPAEGSSGSSGSSGENGAAGNVDVEKAIGSNGANGNGKGDVDGSPSVKSTRVLQGTESEDEEVILGPQKKVDVRSPRRSTVTFGQTRDTPDGATLAAARKEAESVGRSRGRTVAAAQGGRGSAPGGLEGIELEKVKSGEAI